MCSPHLSLGPHQASLPISADLISYQAHSADSKMPVSKLPGHQNSVQLLATSKDRASPDVSSYPKMPGVISGWKFGDLDRQMTEVSFSHLQPRE